MKKYKSKIGFALALIITISLGFTSTVMIINKAWAGFVLIFFVVAFIFYLYNQTFYIVKNDELIIKCGFISKEVVEIKSISKIEETNDPISSPAFSLDRIAIYYGLKDRILISPKYKTEFINHLKNENPKIQVIIKSTNNKT